MDEEIEVGVFEPKDFMIPQPGVLSFIGSSKTGKSTALTNILEDEEKNFLHPFEKIYMIHTYADPKNIDRLKKKYGTRLVLIKNWDPDFLEKENLLDRDINDPHILIILDDVLESVANCPKFQALSTGASSHLNITIIFCSQLLHLRGDSLRAFLRNSDALFLFNTVKSRFAYKRVGIDMNYNGSLVPEIMSKIQSCHPYAYLIVDQRPQIHEYLRFRLGGVSHLSDIDSIYVFRPS